MTDLAKTILFALAAAASLAGAFIAVPSEETFDADDFVGERLNQFGVDDAKSLKIVKFDKESRQQREFEVAESDGLWSIPSKQDYPADAIEQMAAAATCLMDREVLRVAATTPGEHKALGVLDPSTSRSGTNSEGIGTRVIISDSKDETLADMVIGKEVKDAEGQHYVRNTNQDLVYVVNIDPGELSTKFSDWIEDDLLQLSPLDIQRVTIKDYSALMQRVITPQGLLQSRVEMELRNEFELRYDDEDSQWVAESLKEFDSEKQQMVDFELNEEQELNEEVLRELRNGLDELLLVDVERKPEGLGADLKAGEGFLDSEGANNLFNRGFAPMERSMDKEIISSEGEVSCTLKNGVEYLLRFGNLKSDSTEEDASEEEADGTSPEEEAQSAAEIGIHRYLFIMARFNKDMIEAPVLDALPELPAGVTEEDLAEVAVEDTESEVETQEEPGDESDVEEAATEEEEEEAEEPVETEDAEETLEAETDTVPVEETNEDAVRDETSVAEAATDDESSQEVEVETETMNEELQKLIEERKRIEEENQRRLDEYQDKIEEGEKRVKELNERFGDWYYVIDNKAFKKIHIGRDQLIKKKEAKTDEENTAPPQGIPGLPNLPIGGAK